MTDKSPPKWIWASFLDPTDDCGSFCAPRPHMNGGPPNNDAIKYIRGDIYETQAKRIKELEAALKIYANENEWTGIPWRLLFNSDHMDAGGYETARRALLPTPPKTEETP